MMTNQKLKCCDEIEITSISDKSPVPGCFDIVRFGNKYFRTEDMEGYASSLENISEKEYQELLRYRTKDKE